MRSNMKPILLDKRCVGSIGLALVVFFISRALIPIAFMLIPGSPTHISSSTANQSPTPQEVTSFLVYSDMLIGTFPYLLSGFVAAVIGGTCSSFFCGMTLLAVSHFLYPIVWASIAYDYVRLCAFGLGVAAGLSLSLVWKLGPKEGSSKG